MKPEDNDNSADVTLLKGLAASASPQDEAFLRRLKDESTKAFQVAADRRMRQRRLIMKGIRWFTPAAAACIIAALVAWVGWPGGPGVSSAYAEMTKALDNSKAAEWAHVKAGIDDEEYEQWLSIRPFRLASKQRNGRVTYGSEVEHRQYEFDPHTNTITVTALSVPDRTKMTGSFLDFALKSVAPSGGPVPTKTTEKINGNTMTVFTVRNDQKNATYRFIVDPKTQRVVRWECIHIGDTIKSVRKADTGMDIDYPDAGPADIYALGVPRTARIVDLTKPHDIRQKARAASEAFTPSYYAVVSKESVRPDGARYLNDVVIVYKKNGKWRLERYVSTMGSQARSEAGSRNIQTNDVTKLEAWAKDGPVSSILFVSSLKNMIGDSFKVTKEGKLVKMNYWHFMSPDDLPERRFFMVINGQEMTKDQAGKWGHLVGFELQVQGHAEPNGPLSSYPSRYRAFVNPARGYVQERFVHLDDAKGPWQIKKDWTKGLNDWSRRGFDANRYYEETKQVTEYAKTSAGQWYPRRIETTLRQKPTDKAAITEIVTIHLDTKREIPDSIMNPNSVTSPEPFMKNRGAWYDQ